MLFRSTEKGKLKKFYTITYSGKKCFHDWLCRPIDNGATKNPELSKIYFLGFAEKETRLKLIENRIDGLKKMLSDLKKICDDGATLLNENKDNDIFRYQLQTAVYGRDLMKFNIEWYNRLLKNIEE